MALPPVNMHNYSFIDPENMYQFSVGKDNDDYFKNSYLKSADDEMDSIIVNKDYDIEYLIEQASDMIDNTKDVEIGNCIKKVVMIAPSVDIH
jgi:hypothetical protein